MQTNFKQFLSVVFIVFLSVTLLSGFILNSHTLNKSVNTYFEQTNLSIFTDFTPKTGNFTPYSNFTHT